MLQVAQYRTTLRGRQGSQQRVIIAPMLLYYVIIMKKEMKKKGNSIDNNNAKRSHRRRMRMRGIFRDFDLDRHNAYNTYHDEGS